MSTFNRGKLLKLARAGKLVCIGSYNYSETLGEATGRNTIPVRVKENYGDFKDGFCNMAENDFKGKSGTAYTNSDGTITLIVHSNSNFTFRITS